MRTAPHNYLRTFRKRSALTQVETAYLLGALSANSPPSKRFEVTDCSTRTLGLQGDLAPARVCPWTPVAGHARVRRGKVAAGACQEGGGGPQPASRMVNLTTLAPDIVATVLNETLPPNLTLLDLAVDPQALSEVQTPRIGIPLCR